MVEVEVNTENLDAGKRYTIRCLSIMGLTETCGVFIRMNETNNPVRRYCLFQTEGFGNAPVLFDTACNWRFYETE